MDRVRMFAATAIAAMVVLAGGAAAAQDETARLRGERLANDLCSGCHLVVQDRRTTTVDGVPTFAAIAGSGLTEAALRAWLSDPHPPMPEMPLSDADIAAIVAFIRSYAD